MTIRNFIMSLARVRRRIHTGCCWLLAPVATSVKGTLDRNDFRPVIAKMLVLAGAAGAGIKAALHDPEVMGAAAILAIAVISGILEAISRANLGATSGTDPSTFAHQVPAIEGASRDARPRP